MLHRALLVTSSVRGCINATVCIMACQTRTSKVYRERRMLLHELFAKLHDAIGYLCVAEFTTRSPTSVIKPSKYNSLCILLVYSRHTDSRVFWSSLYTMLVLCNHGLLATSSMRLTAN